MTDDEFKMKIFPWIYDTKSIKDSEKRGDILTEKIAKIFPNSRIHIFVSC